MGSRRPVIAIAGLGCETSTFTPSRTSDQAFHPRRGRDAVEQYSFLHSGTKLGDAAYWRGILTGHALPGGVVTRAAFEKLSGIIVADLMALDSQCGLDGLWFDIHGAMCVEGLDDSEAELLRRIRRVIGPDVLVSTSMDLHGNVSRDLAHQTDLITCFRTAPHVDVRETKERACRYLVEVLARRSSLVEEGRTFKLPVKAWIPVPVLLAGEQTSTRMEPAKSIYAAVDEVEREAEVLDAAIWVGYAWADEARDCAVVVVTGWDESVVARAAEGLAEKFWNSHEDFRFVAPTGSLEQCLSVAIKAPARPYFLSDSGDNPTAGGSGDVTWTLHQILARPEFKSSDGPKVVYASIPGPTAVEVAVKAGVGGEVTVTAGAEVDDIHSGPIIIKGRVHAIKHGDRDAVIEVVIQTGSVFVILTKLRKPYHHEHDFTDLNLDLRCTADLVVVKIGYLEPELYDMAADWMLALTPGGVDQDLVRLGHKRIHRPMYPFDKKFDRQPDLQARLIATPREPLDDSDGWILT